MLNIMIIRIITMTMIIIIILILIMITIMINYTYSVLKSRYPRWSGVARLPAGSVAV